MAAVQTGDVRVRELRSSDIPHFFKWGTHPDTRFLHYNFPILTPEEQQYWYRTKKVSFRRWIYVAEYEGQLLGYMSVKNISHIFRTGELGIVFNPAIVGRGFGTASMIAFLRIYFEEKWMRELHLRVALFNHRAQRSYEKVGFQYVRTIRAPFEEQERNFELLVNYPEDFWMEDNLLMSTFHVMRITRKRYRQLYGKENLR